MERHRFVSIILFSIFLSTLLIGISARSQAVNLVKEEMIALDVAFKKIIDAVVLGNAFN